MVGLRVQAESDLREILSDPDSAVWPITVTDPNGVFGTFDGRSNDIHLMVDPDTGEGVSGRQASVAISIREALAAFSALPEAVADVSGLPWVVEFDDLFGASYKFKVSESNPDRTAGLHLCFLEAYTG